MGRATKYIYYINDEKMFLSENVENHGKEESQGKHYQNLNKIVFKEKKSCQIKKRINVRISTWTWFVQHNCFLKLKKKKIFKLGFKKIKSTKCSIFFWYTLYIISEFSQDTVYLISEFSSHVLGDELLGLADHSRHTPVLLVNLKVWSDK